MVWDAVFSADSAYLVTLPLTRLRDFGMCRRHVRCERREEGGGGCRRPPVTTPSPFAPSHLLLHQTDANPEPTLPAPPPRLPSFPFSRTDRAIRHYTGLSCHRRSHRPRLAEADARNFGRVALGLGRRAARPSGCPARPAHTGDQAASSGGRRPDAPGKPGRGARPRKSELGRDRPEAKSRIGSSTDRIACHLAPCSSSSLYCLRTFSIPVLLVAVLKRLKEKEPSAVEEAERGRQKRALIVGVGEHGRHGGTEAA